MNKNAYSNILTISVCKTTHLNFIVLGNHFVNVGKIIGEHVSRSCRLQRLLSFYVLNKCMPLLALPQQAHALTRTIFVRHHAIYKIKPYVQSVASYDNTQGSWYM